MEVGPEMKTGRGWEVLSEANQAPGVWKPLDSGLQSFSFVPETLPGPVGVVPTNEDASLPPDTHILRAILVLPPASQWEPEETQRSAPTFLLLPTKPSPRDGTVSPALTCSKWQVQRQGTLSLRVRREGSPGLCGDVQSV